MVGKIVVENGAVQVDYKIRGNGRRTGIDPSDVVAAVNDLEGRRFVIRARDQHDARRNVITLTAAGDKELARLDAVVAGIQERFLAPLTDAERRQLHRLLEKLAGH